MVREMVSQLESEYLMAFMLDVEDGKAQGLEMREFLINHCVYNPRFLALKDTCIDSRLVKELDRLDATLARNFIKKSKLFHRAVELMEEMRDTFVPRRRISHDIKCELGRMLLSKCGFLAYPEDAFLGECLPRKLVLRLRGGMMENRNKYGN